jgi:hypothetical protein
MVTISPGATAPLEKLAALTTAVMEGNAKVGTAIVKVTGIVCATVPPAAAREITAMYVPAANADGETETDSVAGVTPLNGVIDNQLPELALRICAVNSCALPTLFT